MSIFSSPLWRGIGGRQGSTAFIRSIASRPGQPQDLSRYDKGPETIPVPLTVKRQQAEKMGRLEPLNEPLAKRPVPKNSTEFNANRASFNKALGEVRKQFADAWDERQYREQQAADDFRAAVRERKEHSNIVREEQRNAALAAEAVRYVQSQKAKAERKAKSGQARAAKEARLAHLRQRWLKAVVKDSARWISEDRIDEAITPAAFQMKYAWHLTGWFEAKERKRALREEARRSKQAGVPLREVVLPRDDPAAAYGTDWESDEEAFSPAGVAADADAELDESGRVREALSVARRAFREAGSRFPEPNFDSAGTPLPAEGTAAAAAQSGQAGVGLLNLLTGVAPDSSSSASSAALGRILEEYESWLEGSVVPSMSEEAQRRTPRVVGGAIPLDDGERAPENAYIAACVSSGAVEALFYALLRKRARLQREGCTEGLIALDRTWATWMREVESRVGGMFAKSRKLTPADSASAAEAKAAQEAAQAEASAELTALLTRMADIAQAQPAQAASVAAQKGATDSEDAIDLRNIEAMDAVGKAASSVPLPKEAGGKPTSTAGTGQTDNVDKKQ